MRLKESSSTMSTFEQFLQFFFNNTALSLKNPSSFKLFRRSYED